VARLPETPEMPAQTAPRGGASAASRTVEKRTPAAETDMSKYPLQTTKPNALRRVEPDDADAHDLVPAPGPAGFFSFSWSVTEVTSQGGRTQVRSRRSRLENGKLTNESFEGELDGGAYDQAVRRAQEQVAEQATSLLRALTWWLPPLRGPR